MLTYLYTLANRPLKYPLLWVVLLWALTIPGYEVEVYRLLLFGGQERNAPEMALGTAGEDQAQVNPEEIHVFPDAKAASLPQLEFLLAPAPAPFSGLTSFSGATLLLPELSIASTFSIISRLISSLQPNAP